jgi:hypothetical protein
LGRGSFIQKNCKLNYLTDTSHNTAFVPVGQTQLKPSSGKGISSGFSLTEQLSAFNLTFNSKSAMCSSCGQTAAANAQPDKQMR